MSRLIQFLIEQAPGNDNDNELIIVRGIGQLRIGQLKLRIQEMVQELSALAASAHDAEDWKRVHWMLTNDTLNHYVKALVAHYDRKTQ